MRPAPSPVSCKSRGVRHVIIKLGAKGCLLLEGGHRHACAGAHGEGRGHDRSGRYFQCRIRGGLSEGARAWRRASSRCTRLRVSVTRMGCQASVPTRAELDAYLRQT